MGVRIELKGKVKPMDKHKMTTVASLTMAVIAVIQKVCEKVEEHAPTILSCGLGIVTYEVLNIANTTGDITLDSIGMLAAASCVTAGTKILWDELTSRKSQAIENLEDGNEGR